MVWCALSYGVSSVLASISLGAFVLVRPVGDNSMDLGVYPAARKVKLGTRIPQVECE